MDTIQKAPRQKDESGMGSFYYVNCPKCENTNILGGASGWHSTICGKCSTRIIVEEEKGGS